MKKYSVVALFLLLALFGAFFFVGKSKKEFAVTVPEPTATNTQTSPIVAPKKEVISTPGVILIGDRAKYENLSKEEQSMVKNYYAFFMKGSQPANFEVTPVTNCYVKYYDEQKLLVGCNGGKPGSPINLIERNTWKELNNYNLCMLNLFEGYLETTTYAITVSDGGICYYKAGDKKETAVPNSGFIKSDGKRTLETYVKIGGMANEYDFTFDEPSKTLTIAVFKRDGSIDPARPNRKTRTETFILP